MKSFLFLVLLTGLVVAGGRGEGNSSLAKTARYAVDNNLDTLKFNNSRMLIIVKKINLDSASVEAFAKGLGKDSVEYGSDTLNFLQVKGYCPKDVSLPNNNGIDTSTTSMELLQIKRVKE